LLVLLRRIVRCHCAHKQREEAKAAELARLELDQPAFVAARKQRIALKGAPEPEKSENGAIALVSESDTRKE